MNIYESSVTFIQARRALSVERDGYAATALDVVMLRSPALPLEISEALYVAADPRRALYDLLRDRRDIVEIIRFASESLGQAVDCWIRDEFDPNHSAVLPAFSYVLRCTTRCTPLAACSAVSELIFSEDKHLRCGDRIVRRTRPDAEWILNLASRIEKRSLEIPGLRLWRSGLGCNKGGRVEVADFTRTTVAAVGQAGGIIAVPTAMNHTEALEYALECCAPGTTLESLSTQVAHRTNSSHEHAMQLVGKLLDLGLLVSELRVSLTGDPVAELLAVLKRLELPEARDIEKIMQLCGRSDASDISEAYSFLEDALDIAKRMGKATTYFQIDAAREAFGALPSDLAENVWIALATLARIAPKPKVSTAIARAFSERYNIGREVPLLEVLDAQEGFAFEEVIKQQRTITHDERDVILQNLAFNAYASGVSAIELDPKIVARLEAASGRISDAAALPETFESIFRLVNHGGCTIAVVQVAHRIAFRSMGRFLDLLPDLYEKVKAHTFACDGGDHWICAELVTYPHNRRSANVSIRRQTLGYEIVAGIRSSTSEECTITLDELVVGASSNELYVRCPRLGKYVSVMPMHMLNPSRSSRLELLFSYIHRDPVALIAFDWGRFARDLPYLPRVSVGSTIVAPQTWCVPVTVASSAKEWHTWRSRWRIPSRVCITTFDNRLPVDLDTEIGRELMADAAKRLNGKGTVRLEELIQDFRLGPMHGQSGTYALEVAMPFRATLGAPALPDPQPVISRATYLRSPGSDWVAIHAYLGAERAALFLEKRLPAILQSLLESADLFHFVRYADPAHHLRLRFHAATAREDVTMRVLREFSALNEAGVVSRFAVQTYDREVERYGGSDSIALAETIFHYDSLRTLGELSAMKSSRNDTSICSLARFAECLLGSADASRGWLKVAFGRRPRLPKQIWEHVRSARETYLLQPVSDLDISIKHSAEQLRQIVAPGRLNSTLRALLHMHCNRLGLSSTEELMYSHASSALFDQLAHADEPQRLVRVPR